MVVRQTHPHALFLLTLFALQQSCATNLAPPPSPGKVREAAKAESTGKKETGIGWEPTKAEPITSKFPQLAPEPEKVPGSLEPPVRSESAEVELGIGGVPRHSIEPLPESVLGMPEQDLASPRIHYDTVLLARASNTPINPGWQYRKDRQRKIVGFDFSNRGGNRILPPRYDIDKNRVFTRDFQFRFDDRARQDIHLFLSDWAPSRDGQFRLSELMNSVLHFFPRNYLPAVVSSGGRSIVTLPTGEEVAFDARTYEVLGGVFSEAPVDLNPNKAARKFPGIHYIGKGVVVRADARGNDPRLGTTATIATGSPASNCKKGTQCNQCRVPSKELWEQGGAVRFKFSTDEQFDRYLMSRCEFRLPKTEAEFAMRQNHSARLP